MATKKTKKKEEVVALDPGVESTPTPEVETEAGVEVADEKGLCNVLSPRGSVVRTYSKAIHGAEYKKLAKQYADKIGGTAR